MKLFSISAVALLASVSLALTACEKAPEAVDPAAPGEAMAPLEEPPADQSTVPSSDGAVTAPAATTGATSPDAGAVAPDVAPADAGTVQAPIQTSTP